MKKTIFTLSILSFHTYTYGVGIAVSLNNDIITTTEQQDYTTYTAQQLGIKALPPVATTALQKRLGQILAMNTITESVQLPKTKNITGQPPIIKEYLKSKEKWTVYTQQYITPNTKLPTITNAQRIRKVQIITLPQSESSYAVMQWIKKSLKNKEFGQMAYHFSNHISWTNKGRIGWISKESVPYKLGQMVYNVSIGDISPIFKYGNSYAIIKVNDEQINKSVHKKNIQTPIFLIQNKQMRLLNIYTTQIKIHNNAK